VRFLHRLGDDFPSSPPPFSLIFIVTRIVIWRQEKDMAQSADKQYKTPETDGFWGF
jgi:hypothetical protein